MPKRVLLICYYFPPMGGGGVGRPLSLFKQLKEHDIDCHVLTVKPSTFRVYDPDLIDESENYRIYRSGSFDPQRILHLFGLRDMSNKSIGSGKKLSSKFFPDSKIGWVRSAIRLGRQLVSAHGYDCIISTAPPISVHLVASKLSRETNLKWIADFRDYWTSYPIEQTYTDPEQISRAQSLLQKIKSEATIVTAVNKQVGEYVGADSEISNSFDSDTLDCWEAPDQDKFVIGLFGTFNNISPVQPLFKQLKQLQESQPDFLKRIKLLQVGDTNAEWFKSEMSLADLSVEYELTGFVNRTEAIKKISAASIFYISLSKEMPLGISTGRLFYLLSSRRPILAYCSHESEMSKIVNSTGLSCAFDETTDQKPVSFISEMIEDHQKGNELPLTSIDSIQKFSSDTMVQAFACIINEQ